MTAEARDAVRRLVAAAPPLRPEQVAKLRLIGRGAR